MILFGRPAFSRPPVHRIALVPIKMLTSVFVLAALAAQAAAHCELYPRSQLSIHSRQSSDTFPNLVVGGVKTGDWVNVRRTNNYNTQSPVRGSYIAMYSHLLTAMPGHRRVEHRLALLHFRD